MKPVILLDGQPVEPQASPHVSLDIVETEPGVYSVIADSLVFEVRRGDSDVMIAGRRFTFSVEDPRVWKHDAAGGGVHGKASIIAPMPGKVVRVLVAQGEEVKQGQGIVVLEAMKMQNEMKSPRDGRVTRLEVRENDSVTAGSLMAVVE